MPDQIQPEYHEGQDAGIHYLRWGERGPRVVLLHPIGFDCHTWDAVAPSLQDDFQLLALDLPGHGVSERPPGADYRLSALAAQVFRLLDQLKWRTAAFVGNSIGGGVSLAAALQAPDRVTRLVLLNSVAFRTGLPPLGRLAFLPAISLICGRASGWSTGLALRYARAGWGRCGPGTADRCTRYLRDPGGRTAFLQTLRLLYGPELDSLAERYGEIRCPSLVIHGEGDPLIPVRHSERLARSLHDAPLVRLPHCGHFPQEEQPQRTAAEIRQFLPAN